MVRHHGGVAAPARSSRLTSMLGVALGAAFAICFLTGVTSHLIQHPPSWFSWPSRPVGLYRVTQGVHVATGLACIPLLGAKLWSVYPRLFIWPPVRSVVHAMERASIAVLVAAALFQVIGGIANLAGWYGLLGFFFTSGHYWGAWLAAGALIVHVGIQLPVIRESLTDAPLDSTVAGTLSRRGFLGAVGAAAGLITVTTVGQTVAPLSPVAVLAPRRPRDGPQHVPVNRTAAGAGVHDASTGPDYRLTVTGPARTVDLTLADLAAMPQHTAELPISCVEGWSSTGTWSGVRLRELVALVDAGPADVRVVVESLEVRGRYRTSAVAGALVNDPLTLIALRLGGEPLHPDHGYPARLIAPNRPGVLQTKWVNRITVRAAS